MVFDMFFRHTRGEGDQGFRSRWPGVDKTINSWTLVSANEPEDAFAQAMGFR
jgi:hypothetical protein